MTPGEASLGPPTTCSGAGLGRPAGCNGTSAHEARVVGLPVTIVGMLVVTWPEAHDGVGLAVAGGLDVDPAADGVDSTTTTATTARRVRVRLPRGTVMSPLRRSVGNGHGERRAPHTATAPVCRSLG